MNRLETEAPFVIDARYESMLEKIIAKLNQNGTCLGKALSPHLLFFSLAIAFVKFLSQ